MLVGMFRRVQLTRDVAKKVPHKSSPCAFTTPPPLNALYTITIPIWNASPFADAFTRTTILSLGDVIVLTFTIPRYPFFLDPLFRR
jgi:hypothetical protein